MTSSESVSQKEKASAAGLLGPAALLIGTIVGAGIFALPATAARSGLVVTLVWLAVLTGLILLFHRMFAEIVVRTESVHRLPGYVRIYLGVGAQRIALINAFVGGLGGLLIYLVLIEQFFSDFVPVSEGIFVPLAWFFLVVLIALGIKTIERIELWMSVGMIALVFALAAFAAPRAQVVNFSLVNGISDALLPFGVLLFSLGGFNAIPEMREFFIGNGKGFWSAIKIGTLVPSILYAIFMVAFVGAFGNDISDNLSETVAILGGVPLALLTALGAVAIATSFLVIGAYTVDTLRYDLNVRHHIAILILAVPLIIYTLGVREFVTLAAFIGTVFIGSDGILLLLTWRAVKKKNSTTSATLDLRVPRWAFYTVMSLFVLGVLVSLKSFL